MPPSKEKTGIFIDAPDEQQVIVPLVGASPLLCNRFTEEAQATILGTPGVKKIKPSNYGDPEKRWRKALHVIDADARKFGFPSNAFHAGLIKAGGRFTDTPMTEWRGRFHIPFCLLEIRGSDPEMNFAWCRQMGKPMPAFRAEFKEWEMDVPVSYDAKLLSLEQLLTLFERMGYSIGVGAFRPECTGPYGRFTVKRG